MAENKTNEADTTSAQVAPTSIEEAIALIQQPDAVKDMFSGKLLIADKLIRENNSRVLQIREAKNSDPNNNEYLDNVWHRVIADKVDDKELIAAEKKYQAAVAESEKQLAILRAGAKARHIQPTLTDEQTQALKKSINEGKSVIAEAKASAAAFAEMADTFLKMAGVEIEGGVISLLPEPESLLNTRGRKATSSEDRPYFTRLVNAEINGKSTNKDKKDKATGEIVKGGNAHFNNVAEELSKMFGANTFPENGVTPKEVEEAYYKSNNATYRESAEMPEDYTFDFTKEIKVQNANDDSTKNEPHTVKIRIVRWTADTIAEPAKADAEKK